MGNFGIGNRHAILVTFPDNVFLTIWKILRNLGWFLARNFGAHLSGWVGLRVKAMAWAFLAPDAIPSNLLQNKLSNQESLLTWEFLREHGFGPDRYITLRGKPSTVTLPELAEVIVAEPLSSLGFCDDTGERMVAARML